jgi:serine/threonine-protein kinase HipA
MNNTPDSPAKPPDDRTDQGGNYWTLFTPRTWKVLHAVLQPQGHARVKLAQVLQVNPDTDACELPLLLRAGGSPIGNLRDREAWQREQERVVNVRHPGLTMDEIVSLDERFLTLAAEFAALASGSSGVQGAWPKVLLTQGIDGRWYPDPMVADRDATDHVIVKWVGDKEPSTQLILASEAPYLELEREFDGTASRLGVKQLSQSAGMNR